MAVDLLETQATLEAELRGLKEARALAVSNGKSFSRDKHNRVVELESMVEAIRDAERFEVAKQREAKRRAVKKARAELRAEVNDLWPQYQDAMLAAELGARELVGSLLRARELVEMIRERVHALSGESPRPLSANDWETRTSGRITAILSGLSHPKNQFGNIAWHSMGQFLENDKWAGREARLIRPHLKEILNDGNDSNDEA